MADSKSEIVVHQGTDQGGLVARGEPVTARNAPAIVKAAGRSAKIIDSQECNVRQSRRSRDDQELLWGSVDASQFPLPRTLLS